MAPPSGSKTASKAVSDGAGRLRVRHQALKLRSSGLVGGHDEAGDHFLVAGLVEADVEALALHRGDAAVADLLMEHAVADRKSGVGERVCQYGELSVVAGSLKKKKTNKITK